MLPSRRFSSQNQASTQAPCARGRNEAPAAPPPFPQPCFNSGPFFQGQEPYDLAAEESVLGGLQLGPLVSGAGTASTPWRRRRRARSFNSGPSVQGQEPTRKSSPTAMATHRFNSGPLCQGRERVRIVQRRQDLPASTQASFFKRLNVLEPLSRARREPRFNASLPGWKAKKDAGSGDPRWLRHFNSGSPSQGAERQHPERKLHLLRRFNAARFISGWNSEHEVDQPPRVAASTRARLSSGCNGWGRASPVTASRLQRRPS